jgi:hypothetical protein
MLENGKMDRMSIERLAIDSAAGELSKDAEALLKAYLAEHPDEKKWAEDMLDIYQATQMTIDAKTKHLAVADESMAVREKLRLPVNWLPVGRWAAVVIFSALIGVTAGRLSKSPIVEQNPQRVAIAQGTTEEKPTIDLENVGESFWRKKAVAMITSPSYMTHGDYVKGSKLWEKYRRFIKERNYEQSH